MKRVIERDRLVAVLNVPSQGSARHRLLSAWRGGGLLLPLVWLAQQGAAAAQGLKDYEGASGLGRGVGEQGHGMLVFFWGALLAMVPLGALAYLLLRWFLNRALEDKVSRPRDEETDSFFFSAVLLLIGYVSTVVMVGTISNSWVLGSWNIATNVLWLVTIAIFYLLYKVAKEDYSLSKGVKVFVSTSIFLAAVLTNVISKGWSPIDLSKNRAGGVTTIVLMAVLVVLVLGYLSVSIFYKVRENRKLRREQERAAKLKALAEEKHIFVDQERVRIS
ncbi:MAG: hypothetical protein FJ276_29295 [Planctomycetes bacterium]|nr:hypothetical protein [Planctomycetota bacterium]